MLQLAFGADILWRQRRLVLLALLPMTLYLSLADALAIGFGTWTINPALSLEIYLGGVLPLEELLFFLLTNMLLTFGMTLVLARQSQQRIDRFLKHRFFRTGSFFPLQPGGRER
jgi:lycopene cyclase domain-containing protein